MNEERVQDNVFVTTSNGDKIKFKAANVTLSSIENARRDAGRFFFLANVEERGQGLFPVCPLKGKQKIGIFAESMLESAESIMRAYEHAPNGVSEYIKELVPILEEVKNFDESAQAAMVALFYMGHEAETIIYLFLHFNYKEEWP